MMCRRENRKKLIFRFRKSSFRAEESHFLNFKWLHFFLEKSQNPWKSWKSWKSGKSSLACRGRLRRGSSWLLPSFWWVLQWKYVFCKYLHCLKSKNLRFPSIYEDSYAQPLPLSLIYAPEVLALVGISLLKCSKILKNAWTRSKAVRYVSKSLAKLHLQHFSCVAWIQRRCTPF